MADQPQPTGPTRDQLVEIAVQQAAQASEGSFADRNPMLGKMVRCPYCGHRRRQEEACCNPKYLATVKNDVPRSFYAKHRKIPRLTRNRPPLFEIHAILLDNEKKECCTICGKIWDYHFDGHCYSKSDPKNYFHLAEHEGISGIVEAQIIRRRKLKAKVKRNQQKEKSQN